MRTALIFAIAVILLFPVTAHAQARQFFWASVGFDLGTSEAARRAGMVEQDPILENAFTRWSDRRIGAPVTSDLIVVGIGVAFDRFAMKIRYTHPKLMTAFFIMAGAPHAVVAIKNLRELKR